MDESAIYSGADHEKEQDSNQMFEQKQAKIFNLIHHNRFGWVILLQLWAKQMHNKGLKF